MLFMLTVGANIGRLFSAFLAFIARSSSSIFHLAISLSRSFSIFFCSSNAISVRLVLRIRLVNFASYLLFVLIFALLVAKFKSVTKLSCSSSNNRIAHLRTAYNFNTRHTRSNYNESLDLTRRYHNSLKFSIFFFFIIHIYLLQQ